MPISEPNPKRDATVRLHQETKEQEFHAALVKKGLRPEGSKAEDFRKRPAGFPAEGA